MRTALVSPAEELARCWSEEGSSPEEVLSIG